MHWHTQTIISKTNPQSRQKEIINALFTTRGLTTATKKEAFLHPPSPQTLTPSKTGLDPKQLVSIAKRLQVATANKQPILIYGDYDADGITATAIIWETLNHIGAKAFPFIPNREAHGYGLSEKGLVSALDHYHLSQKNPLILTVDNGISAFKAAMSLQEQGIELIITDHHQLGKTLPPHSLLLHTTILSGAGVAWMLAKELDSSCAQNTIDLVTIGTVADMMPLVGPNRSIVKFGLQALRNTKRPGLLALYQLAGVGSTQSLSTYHINFIIAPRLNAMGRLEHAIDSLRLICTPNQARALDLANLLSDTNKTRQDLTDEFILLANQNLTDPTQHVLVIDHTDFHEGVIGLVAGKLVETHARPAIVIARGQEVSKGSARSVTGINIIELIRRFETNLINAGGHPMAAGFTISTTNIKEFKSAIETEAKKTIDPSLLVHTLTIECQIKLADINQDLYALLQDFHPHGIANPTPIFSILNARLLSAKTVGRDHRHLKITIQDNQGNTFDGIGFNLGPKIGTLVTTPHADLAFCLEQNTFNGKTTLQLHLKDIKPSV